VVANLPYNITSDALKRMLPMGDHISDLILMVQYEAAERLVSSSAGDGDYRPISVRVHFYSEPSFIRKVRASAGPSDVFCCCEMRWLVPRAEEEKDRKRVLSIDRHGRTAHATTCVADGGDFAWPAHTA